MKCKKGKKHRWSRWVRKNRTIGMPVRFRQCQRCHRWQAQMLRKNGTWR